MSTSLYNRNDKNIWNVTTVYNIEEDNKVDVSPMTTYEYYVNNQYSLYFI